MAEHRTIRARLDPSVLFPPLPIMAPVVQRRPCVYAITHRETGRAYIGSAVDAPNRWRRHRRLLDIRRHDNVHLQRAWNAYGAPAFDFTVVEWTARDERKVREAALIAERDPRALYNVSAVVMPGGPPPSAKLTPADVAAIAERIRSGERYKAIAADYGVHHATVQRIAKGRTWGGAIEPVDRRRMGQSHKIPRVDVPVIRQRLANGEQCTVIAREYGVTPPAIGAIKHGRTGRSLVAQGAAA